MYHKSEFYNKGLLSVHPDVPMIRTGTDPISYLPVPHFLPLPGVGPVKAVRLGEQVTRPGGHRDRT